MKSSLMLAVVVSIVLVTGSAWGHDRDRVIVRQFAAVLFAKLPREVHFPEGIAANPHNGDIFVGTFDFGGNNKVLRFDRQGRLKAALDFGTPLLGLAFNKKDGKVYICNAGSLATGDPAQAKIQRVPANFGPSTLVEDVASIPIVGAPANRTEGNPDGSSDTIAFGNNLPAPNAMTFNRDGDLLFSDSFQGAIFRVDDVKNCATPCAATTVVHSPLLATAGFPPFGANGLALSKDELTLFVANTGDDRVLRVDLTLPLGDPNQVTPFAESINGADGLARDHEGNLWVAANQADQVVALDKNGRVIAELGEFLGINRDGTANGLIFPASLAIVGDDIFVTNLALPLTPATEDEWEEEVTRYTISRIRIPGQLR